MLIENIVNIICLIILFICLIFVIIQLGLYELIPSITYLIARCKNKCYKKNIHNVQIIPINECDILECDILEYNPMQIEIIV